MIAMIDNQLVALAGVFVICMIGVVYHQIETRRIRRKRRAARNAGTSSA